MVKGDRRTDSREARPSCVRSGLALMAAPVSAGGSCAVTIGLGSSSRRGKRINIPTARQNGCPMGARTSRPWCG